MFRPLQDSQTQFPESLLIPETYFFRSLLEVTGEKRADKEAKVSTARNLWVPAINNDGRFGKWAFLELRDPWNAKTEITDFLAEADAMQTDKRTNG